MQVLLGRLDERRQRRDRGARAEGNELRRQRGKREAPQRDATCDCHDRIEQQRNDDARDRVGNDIEANRARQHRAGMDGQWKDEREYAQWRNEDNPADEDEHGVA